MAKDYEVFFDNVGFNEEERQITLDYMKELFSLIITELNANTDNDRL
jgi:hypothetical protein